MARIRAVVVEDSLTIRRYLAERLAADPEIEVVAQAEDGKQAIELVERLRPDVVTLDMMLPVLSGLTATEYIMAYCPTPILIVSSSHNRGEVFKTYDALSAGAVDVMEKPRGDQFDPGWDKRFIATVKLISKIKVITHPRAKFARASRGPVPAAEGLGLPAPESPYQCVAIGASTGGPAAVLELLCGLGADFPLPILLVIHIGEPFGVALCDWLDGLSPIRVSWATPGEMLPAPGAAKVFMAPHHQHLVVRERRLWHTDAPERHSCRPSVDVLFESVAREFASTAIACLLTGMGRDGAAGMRAVRQAGGVTLAQDEESCVIFGMPHEAILLGGASQVLPLGPMAATLRFLAAPDRMARGGPG
jgi:two-component system, chemotaxis family, protein-glutamate methylesterase/glutaminase